MAGSHLMYCRDSNRAVPAWRSSETHVGLGLSCCNGLHISDMADALGDTLPEEQLGTHLQVLWVFQEAEAYHCLLPCSQLVLQQTCGHWLWTVIPIPLSIILSSPPSGAYQASTHPEAVLSFLCGIREFMSQARPPFLKAGDFLRNGA